jgi:hypothetical protein
VKRVEFDEFDGGRKTKGMRNPGRQEKDREGSRSRRRRLEIPNVQPVFLLAFFLPSWVPYSHHPFGWMIG